MPPYEMNMARKYSCFILFLFLLACSKPAEDNAIDDGVVITEDEEQKNKHVQQNQWTYKQMRENYLWEEYLPDTSSMSLAASPQNFFSKLLYTGDRFSWIERNQDFRGTSMYDRFGLETLVYLTPAGEEVYRMALVLPRSPAQKAGLHRGDWFKIIHAAGEMMEIETDGVSGTAFTASSRLSLPVAAQEYTDAVALDSIYRMEGKTTGYLFYNSFQDETNSLSNPYRAELRRIFSNFKEQGITDLVVDLRYNPGGYVSICQFIGSLVLPDEYQGKIAGYHSYNKRRAAILLKETGNGERGTGKMCCTFPPKTPSGRIT
ncbi:hypothetical protein FACS189435_2740 [Bacteroidia bacterium]|nr:hypothetical protein FACS189435_2740 [Bacteroidia bacterium]